MVSIKARAIAAGVLIAALAGVVGGCAGDSTGSAHAHSESDVAEMVDWLEARDLVLEVKTPADPVHQSGLARDLIPLTVRVDIEATDEDLVALADEIRGHLTESRWTADSVDIVLGSGGFSLESPALLDAFLWLRSDPSVQQVDALHGVHMVPWSDGDPVAMVRLLHLIQDRLTAGGASGDLPVSVGSDDNGLLVVGTVTEAPDDAARLLAGLVEGTTWRATRIYVDEFGEQRLDLLVAEEESRATAESRAASIDGVRVRVFTPDEWDF